jgi:putative acetyltransferase
VQVIPADLADPRVLDLLRVHLAAARAETADPGSVHALDVSGLRAPDIEVWAVWEDGALLGVGALRRLSAQEGEVKSMHTAQAARRCGVGAAMLRHVIAVARSERLSRLSLETGSSDYFRPAHALYRSDEFVGCPLFGDYRDDQNSVFMTLDLERSERQGGR